MEFGGKINNNNGEIKRIELYEYRSKILINIFYILKWGIQSWRIDDDKTED